MSKTILPLTVDDEHHICYFSHKELIRDNYHFITSKDHEGDTIFISSIISKENADFIAQACNSHYELVEALEKTTKWMEWWLDQNECECESGHVCGKDKRQIELSEARAALAKAKGSDKINICPEDVT